MLKRLLIVRYTYLVAVVLTLVNSILCLLVGVRQSIEGFVATYRYVTGDEIANPKLPLLDSLDSFLAALVFLIFSLGIMKIFVGYRGGDDELPVWLRIRNFTQLKVLLWETIIVTLVVWSVSIVARSFETLSWNLLVLPAVVLVLSLGLYLMRVGERPADEHRLADEHPPGRTA